MVTYLKLAKEFSMEHKVEDGPITIVRVVNSCLYWVRCSNCFSLSDIEGILKSANPKKADEVKRGDKVVVRCFDGHYCRGVVQNPVPTTCGNKTLFRYKVFLIDAMSIFIFEAEQILRAERRTCLDDVSQQLHLVGIQFGKPTGILEFGFHADEAMYSEFQRTQILRYLKNIEWVEFQSKQKCDSVTYGKIKLFGKKYENLLRVLIDLNLATYIENFESILEISGLIDRTERELEGSKNLLSPPPLDDSPQKVPSRQVPPPPEVVYDQQQALRLKELMKNWGSLNVLDRFVPNLTVESFEEMNSRYRTIMRQNDPACRERRHETTGSSPLIDSFIDVESDSDTSKRKYPPTSSSEDHSDTSSLYLSSQESENINETTSFSESDGSYVDISKKLSEHYHSSDANPNNNNERTNSGKRSEMSIRNDVSPKKLTFGRGKVFMKYLPTSDGIPPSPPRACTLGQFDDAESGVASRDPPRFTHFISDSESIINFMDGFMDEACDSQDEYYGDILRMDKNVDFSPIATRPVKSSPAASPSMPQPSPDPLGNVRADELSSEESVSSVNMSQCSSDKSNFRLPDVLRINKKRAIREQKLSNSRSDNDSTDSSSHEIFPAQKSTNGVGHEKLVEKTSKLPATLGNWKANSQHPSTEGFDKSSEMPRSKPYIMGRGKIFQGLPNTSQRAGGLMKENGSTTDSLYSPITTPKAELNVAAPLKGIGRGNIFRPFKSSTLPSVEKVNNHAENRPIESSPSKRYISAKSTPQGSEAEETETELDVSSVKAGSLSSVKAGSSSESSLLVKLEAAMKKMTVQAGPGGPDDDSSESESFAPPQPLVKPLLSEFVEESVKQELASVSDDEEGFRKAGALTTNLSDNFLAKISRALKSGAGLLHGATDILPAEHLSNLVIDELIYRNAKNYGVHYLTRPQYFGIPAILKMRNVVFVTPNKTKKSSAFVIPLMSLLMNETFYSSLRKGNGPRCVFVAPTSDRVKILGRLCARYCGAKLTSITTFGGGLELERKNELAAGCDILITTPRCWLRLLQYPTVTNLSRLCHLVLDRFDTLTDLFSPELKQISAKVAELMRVRARKNEAVSRLAVQMVCSAEQWSPELEDVATKLLNKPVVVFTSYVEAILYAGIRPKVTLVKMEARFNKLLGLVQTYWSKKRIVVICVTPGEVTEVRKACSAHFIPIVAHENMAKSLITGVSSQWCSSKQPPMLICTDNVLFELSITDAQVLIHFSLPENKSSFSDRFVVLRDHLPDRILNPKVTPPNCIVHIMFDDATEAPFPFVVDFCRRISVKIPAQVFETVKAIERKKEEEKTSAFCENILQMGSCYKTSSCKSRHIVLPKLDRPSNQQVSKGLVKVQIVHVHSAVKYSARILAHNSNVCGSGTWTKYKSEFMALNFKMGSYFASPRNRRMHGRPKVGDVVAYQEELDRPFFRARVLQITKRDDRQEPTEVEIFLVDEGIERKSLTHTLFELPEDLKKSPDQAVFIYLANLKPVDLDTTWSFAAKKVVDKAIHNTEIEDVDNQDVIGKVLFTIGNNCVVEDLRWCRHLTYTQCFTLDLRQLLLNSGCGLDNPAYSKNLAEICSSANLEFGLYYSSESQNTPPKKIVSKEEREPPRWAHLSHEEDLVLVNTVVRESPSLFYVKMKRFHKTLEELENDLSANLNKSKETLKDPQVGDICATESPEESEDGIPIWNRCLIHDLSGEEADVFFVDYGDIKSVPISNLFTIPWRFVVKLPLQAIECKLAGVLPGIPELGWSEDAIDVFYNLTSKDSHWGEFYVKVMNLDLKGTRTGGRCYHVVLLDFDGDVPIMVNEKFVSMGNGTLTSLDVDETELVEAFTQMKKFESQTDASDEEWDADCSSEDSGKKVPTLDTGIVPAEDTEEPNKFLNFDEVDLEEMKNFLVDTALESQKDLLRRLLQMPAPITAGPKQVDQIEEIPNQLSITASSQKGDARVCQDAQGSVPSCEDGVERPLLVRCAPLKTPLIYWRQDKSTVTIKYMIPCLQIYKVDVNSVSASFRGMLDNDTQRDEYWKRINLFGPVLETSVSEKLTVTCLRVKIFKRVQGYLWPRLTHADSRDHRIKLDPEDGSFGNHREEQDLFDEHFERGYKKFESAGRRKKKKKPDVEEPLNVDLGSSDEEDDDGDEFFEHEEEMADPFNPFL